MATSMFINCTQAGRRELRSNRALGNIGTHDIR